MLIIPCRWAFLDLARWKKMQTPSGTQSAGKATNINIYLTTFLLHKINDASWLEISPHQFWTPVIFTNINRIVGFLFLVSYNCTMSRSWEALGASKGNSAGFLHPSVASKSHANGFVPIGSSDYECRCSTCFFPCSAGSSLQAIWTEQLSGMENKATVVQSIQN